MPFGLDHACVVIVYIGVLDPAVLAIGQVEVLQTIARTF